MIGRRDKLGRIDLTDPNNLSNKVLSEQETRKKLLLKARTEGYEKDLLLLFAKYEKLMKNAKDDKERKDIAIFLIDHEIALIRHRTAAIPAYQLQRLS